MNTDIIDYIFAIAPLFIGHILIPPISHFIGNERYPRELSFLYDFKPHGLNSIKDIERLLYNSSLPLISYQTITHMFVHADMNHLLHNLEGLLYSSYPVYKEFGIYGLYMTFLLGGVSSIIPTPLYDIQKDTNVSKLEKYVSLKDSQLANVIPKSVLTWFDKPLKKVAKEVGNAYYNMATFYFCGSSGGTCALIGCNFIIVIRDSYKLLKKAYLSSLNNNNDNNNNNNRNNRIQRNENKLTFNEKYQLFSYAICTLKTISYFSKELNMVHGNGNDLTIFDNINHAAHLQGSLFGTAFGIIFGIAVPYLQRNRSILL
jgi:membrane associated rhomboid family serine protease